MLKEPGCLIPILFFTLGPLLFVGFDLGDKFEENRALVLFIFLGVCILLGIYLSKILKKGQNKARKIIDDYDTQRKANQEIRNLTIRYSQAKNDVQYLSDKFLINEIMDENLDFITKLAYEEALVERGILESSETHEKLALVKKKFDL
ncbi:hypothetical protein ACWGOQ_0012670 [Aquimarina sp. M1]